MSKDEKTRTLTTAQALGAMANPVRGRIVESLGVDGASTASMLADRLGIAVGSVSHHLKVLAEAGLVVEDPALARDRRERWWRPESRSMRWSRSEFADDHAALAAADTAEELQAARQADRVREWLARSDPKGPWAGAAFSSTSWLHLTPGELAELGGEVVALHRKWDELSQARKDDGDPARETVYLMSRGFPSRP